MKKKLDKLKKMLLYSIVLLIQVLRINLKKYG